MIAGSGSKCSGLQRRSCIAVAWFVPGIGMQLLLEFLDFPALIHYLFLLIGYCFLLMVYRSLLVRHGFQQSLYLTVWLACKSGGGDTALSHQYTADHHDRPKT